MNVVRQVVVQVRKGDAVLRSDRLPNDNFVDVVKLVPVFIPGKRKENVMLKVNSCPTLISSE